MKSALEKNPQAVGDAKNQSVQICNRSYSLIEKIVDSLIENSYDQMDLRIHEQMVFFYNQLLAKNCISTNVCYGIENQNNCWVETIWISNADDTQRVFCATVTHSQIHPTDQNVADSQEYKKLTRLINEKFENIQYCHPVFLKDVTEIFLTFSNLLRNNYAIQLEITKTNWLTMVARANSGRNVVTAISRCFSDASIETFSIRQQSQAHGYELSEIIYN